jgi:hypothetical protein
MPVCELMCQCLYTYIHNSIHTRVSIICRREGYARINGVVCLLFRCLCACVSVCAQRRQTHTHTHTCIYIYIYIQKKREAHTYIHTYIPTYIHEYVNKHISMYIHTYLHTHIYTYTHITYIHTQAGRTRVRTHHATQRSAALARGGVRGVDAACLQDHRSRAAQWC